MIERVFIFIKFVLLSTIDICHKPIGFFTRFRVTYTTFDVAWCAFAVSGAPDLLIVYSREDMCCPHVCHLMLHETEGLEHPCYKRCCLFLCRHVLSVCSLALFKESVIQSQPPIHYEFFLALCCATLSKCLKLG